MMKKLTNVFLAATLLTGGIGSAVAGDSEFFAADNFSATLTLTTDYTFRGTTFSAGDPAIQGSFDWGHGPWFFGVWGTSLQPQDNDDGVGGTLELDIYGGWADTLGGVDLMVMPLLYTFPGQDGDSARDDTTFELWTSIGHGFEGLPGSPYINVAFNWAPDEYFENGDDAYYIKPSIALSLPYGFGLDFAYGYQDIGDGNDFFGDDYSHIEVGLSTSALGFDFDLRYHDNLDEDDLDNIDPGFPLENEVVFSVSRSF